MVLTAVRPGDIVKCNVKGREFFAFVEGREPGKLQVMPITRNITYRQVAANQVEQHFKLMGRIKKTDE